MMNADQIVNILERMTLQHSYNTTDASGRPCKDVWLNIHMTIEEFKDFEELFRDDS